MQRKDCITNSQVMEKMDDNKYMRELSRQITAITQITMEEAAEAIHETTTKCNKADIKPFIQTKNLY